MSDLVVGLGLVLVIEGLLWALVPNLATRLAGGRRIRTAEHPAHCRLELGAGGSRARLDYPRLRGREPAPR